MNKLDPLISKACDEITQNLLTIQDPSKKQVKKEASKDRDAAVATWVEEDVDIRDQWLGVRLQKTRMQKPQKLRLLSSTKGEENRIEL